MARPMPRVPPVTTAIFPCRVSMYTILALVLDRIVTKSETDGVQAEDSPWKGAWSILSVELPRISVSPDRGGRRGPKTRSTTWPQHCSLCGGADFSLRTLLHRSEGRRQAEACPTGQSEQYCG